MPTNRLELISKHKSTIVSIDILSLKLGQVDVKPAVCVSFLTPMPNKEVLPMFSAKLLAFLYENTGRGPKDLVGVAPVTDVPNLTPEATALGAINWEYEQTGCELIIYEGSSKRTLKGGTVRKVKLDCKEGGTVDTYWQYYTAENVDDDVIGHLGILKSLERDVELTAPEIISQQKTLGDEEPGLTPAQGLAKALGQEAPPKSDSKPAANAGKVKRRA